jgi:hypothetical protein
MLPPRECSPNGRYHWAERNRATHMFRYAAMFAVYGSLLAGEREAFAREAAAWRSVVMDVEIGWSCGRKRMDDDNAWASLKAARDGIADALFGGDDRCIVQGTLAQTRGAGVVSVTLREGPV